jgi:YggT family protein
MGYALIRFVDLVQQLLVLVIFVQVVMSYVLPPYHPARAAVDRIVEPLLAPLRRVVPIVGMLDFSPLVLIILVQLLGALIKNIIAIIL